MCLCISNIVHHFSGPNMYVSLLKRPSHHGRTSTDRACRFRGRRGAKGWAPQRSGGANPENVGARRVGCSKFRSLSPSPFAIFILFFSLEVFSWNCGRDSRPQGAQTRNLGGFWGLESRPQFHEKTPRERRKNEHCGVRGEKKSENLGGPAEGGLGESGLEEGGGVSS